MSARGQPRPPHCSGPGPATCPSPRGPAGSAAGAPAPLCHPLLHVTPRAPFPAAPQAAGSPPSLPGPRGKSSVRRGWSPSASRPHPLGPGNSGEKLPLWPPPSLPSPFNYSGAGWRRWGCRKANRWGVGEGSRVHSLRWAPPHLSAPFLVPRSWLGSAFLSFR